MGQNVWFQVGIYMYREKYQLYQIQNGQPAATFDFNMRNNCRKTLPDRYTITIERNVRFQVRIYREKCQLDQIQNGRSVATFDFNMRNNWKTLPDSYRPSLY